MKIALFVLAFLALGLAAWALGERRRAAGFARERAIRAFVFPKHVLDGVSRAHPHLGPKDAQLAAHALRKFFMVHARLPGRTIGLPSKAVDALWHEFILDTRAYRQFCQEAFGGFFHHVPAERMGAGDETGIAMRRTWRIACLEENIDPVHAMRVPLLFAIDTKLGIRDAVPYTADTFKRKRGDSSGCGGGCGGGSDGGCCGSCGGGCGGGGD